MTRLVDVDIYGKKYQVADIKKDYIKNIINAAKSCPEIDKIYWLCHRKRLMIRNN